MGVVSMGNFVYSQHTSMCPSEYKTREEYKASIEKRSEKWFNKFADENPNATITDLKQAFLEENNCADELQTLKEETHNQVPFLLEATS